MHEMSQIWWQEITGPKSFIDAVTNCLQEASVIVRVPDDLPWRHEMRKIIESELRAQNDYAEIVVTLIDAEEIKADKDIGDYFLEELVLQDVARQYRKKSDKSVPRFIAKRGLLQNEVLWVKGLNDASAAKWLTFLLEFNSCNPEHGRIVLEIRDDIMHQKQSAVDEINYSDYISGYNLQLFNSIMLDREPDISEPWKKYISCLATQLCETDAEVAECFVRAFRQDDDPMETLKEIARDPVYARRGSGSGTTHILSLVRNGMISQIQRRIWESQLQVLFPIVESIRINLIAGNKEELYSLLKKRDVRQYGETIENPFDLEWGTLSYALTLKDINDEYYLKLTKAEREIIRSFRDYRNNLAHGDVCSAAQVSDILAVLV